VEVATSQGPPVGERYRALRTVSTIFKVVAWVIAILGTLGVLIASIAAGSSDEGGTGEALVVLIGGGISVALYALFAFAASEMIRLAIAVEENTRRAADAMSSRSG